MITNIKRKDIDRLIGDEINGTQVYYVADQAGDKIRAIYNLFGWNQSRDDMFQVDDTILGLISNCASRLKKKTKIHEATSSTGGICVSLSEEEGIEELQLEIKFNIVG